MSAGLFTHLSEAQVLQDITQMRQSYEKLLYSSGGALNLDKCLWYLISWRWKHGRAKLATIAEAPMSLQLTSGSSHVAHPITRYEPSAAHKTLGVYLAPTGSMTKSKEILHKHSLNYASCLRTAPLTLAEAYWSYTLFYKPQKGYSLRVSTFTEAECKFIQAPALMVILPKLQRTSVASLE